MFNNDDSPKITRSTAMVLEQAETAVANSYSDEITSLHILYGLTRVEGSVAYKILTSYGINANRIWKYITSNVNIYSTNGRNSLIELSAGVANLLQTAKNVAKQLKNPLISTEHLLYAIVANRDCEASRVIESKFGVSCEDIKEKLLKLFSESKNDYVEVQENVFGSNRQNTNSSTLPEGLSELGVDLTARARDGKIDKIIGRDAEIERAIEILCRKTKNNPILIGDAGVGKSAIAEGLALKIVKGEVPNALSHKIIFSLDMASLVAGTQYRGSMEQKLKSAIETITQSQNIIVFIDEIHTLVQASSEKGEISPADILKPYLARGEMQTIGATTVEEYRKYIESDKALERRFQPIQVAPPSVEDTIKILQGIRPSYEKFHNVTIPDEAIVNAVKLSERYITDRNLPDKAIDLIDEASSRANVNNKSQSPVSITDEDIAVVVSKWTGIPVNKIGATEAEKLKNLEQILQKRVVGQDEAVKEVCKALRRSRMGLQDEKRPIGSFLFLGKTGVGKTELCKALAESVFDSEKALIRIDMSEYMESHSVSKLIGSPPGYVGHDDGGQLTEQVRRRPYSVVLFDEIEKAHNDVLNILLQLLDDGRLTDGKGKTVNFKNTIIIMTSNIGADKLDASRRNIGFESRFERTQAEEASYQEQKALMLEEMKKRLKPELINRFDSIVVFHNLSKFDMAKIATIIISNLNNRLKEKDITLKLSEKALKQIVEKGCDYNYGARPLKRYIQREIEDALVEKMLNKEIENAKQITVDVENGQFVFIAN